MFNTTANPDSFVRTHKEDLKTQGRGLLCTAIAADTVSETVDMVSERKVGV